MYSLPERIIHKISEQTTKIRAPYLQKQLIQKDFTIISNNCWGGIVYENYGLPKNSPTVGGYFYASDYIKFISNLEKYLSSEIQMITVNESKHKNSILAKGAENISLPIGLIDDDIEFVFLHYKDPVVAKDKWMRRLERVNYKNLIFKFSYMNECNEDLAKLFREIDLPGRKIMFVHKEELMGNCTVLYPGFEKSEQLPNDTFYWNKYFDVTAFLNGKGII